jgi:hypothetical protein
MVIIYKIFLIIEIDILYITINITYILYDPNTT